MTRIRKTEHSGAKNGGGYWGTREEAKSLSKKLSRDLGKKIVEKKLPKVTNKSSKRAVKTK